MDSIQRLIQKIEEEERIIRQITEAGEQAKRIAEWDSGLWLLKEEALIQRAEETRLAMGNLRWDNSVSQMAQEAFLNRDQVMSSVRLTENTTNRMQLLTSSYHKTSLDDILNYTSSTQNFSAIFNGLLSAREALASGYEQIIRFQKDNNFLAPNVIIPDIHTSWLTKLSQETTETIIQGGAIEIALAAEEEARLNHLDSIATQAGSFGDISTSIGQLYSSFNSLADDLLDTQKLLSLPSCTLPGASREIIVANYVYRKNDEKQERGKERQNNAIIQIVHENIDLPDLLEEIDPDLAQIHRGASLAITSKNPERVRHVMSSYRDLWTHLIESLIPDNSVLLWLKDKHPKEIVSRKPTRKGRLLYVEQNLAGGKLAEFIEWDITTIVKHWQGLNQVHRKTHKLSDDDLQALKLRSDTYLRFIICLVKGISIN
ncbi:MAG: hypothetical protein V1806_16045 [Pseudomonadota bacterium]